MIEYKIYPSIEAYYKTYEKLMHNTRNVPVDRVRTFSKRFFTRPDEMQPKMHEIIDHQIGEVPVRVFHPKEGDLPLIVFLHRGGFVYGSIEESSWLCKRLAEETGRAVATVGYRLAPEHPYPTPLEDCISAIEGLRERYPGDLVIAGESAGGCLAAAASLKIPDIETLILFYPMLEAATIMYEAEDPPKPHFIDKETFVWFWDQYIPNQKDRKNPLAVPFEQQDYSKFPKTLLIAAERDPLFAEGVQFIQKLSDAGIETKYSMYPGMIHGFMDFPIDIKEVDPALQEVSEFLNK